MHGLNLGFFGGKRTGDWWRGDSSMRPAEMLRSWPRIRRRGRVRRAPAADAGAADRGVIQVVENAHERPHRNAAPASRSADDDGAQRLTSYTRWVTRSSGTIVVGFSNSSGSARPPVAKNGRPEPKTTGTWFTTTRSISPSLSAWLPI